MPAKKIIGLTFIGGRVGSSLTMGLLKKSGVSVGAISNVADANNPKGYFEIPGMMHYLFDVLYPQLSGFMPYPVELNDAEIQQNLTDKNIVEFEKLFFTNWFKNNPQNITVKVPYLYTSKIFEIIARQNNYEYIPVYLSRQVVSNIQSIKKMNSANNPDSEWQQWFKAWLKVKNKLTFKETINFEDWFTEPYKNYLKLYNTCKPPVKLTEQQVNNYINKKYKHF